MIRLYDKLKDAEELQKNLDYMVESFNTELKDFEHIPGYQNTSIKIIPKLDINAHQKQIFLEYRDHPLLNPVLSERDTLANITSELYNDKYNDWFKRISLRRGDKIYNERVDKLDELIPCGDLRTGGSDETLHPGGAFILMSAISLPIWSMIGLLAKPGFSPWVITGMITSFSVIYPASIATLIACSGSGRSLKDKEKLISQAEYIDKKIKELIK